MKYRFREMPTAGRNLIIIYQSMPLEFNFDIAAITLFFHRRRQAK